MALRTRVKSRLTEGLPFACASATAGPRHVLIQTQRAGHDTPIMGMFVFVKNLILDKKIAENPIQTHLIISLIF